MAIIKTVNIGKTTIHIYDDYIVKNKKEKEIIKQNIQKILIKGLKF